jgi:hypothetical protein
MTAILTACGVPPETVEMTEPGEATVEAPTRPAPERPEDTEVWEPEPPVVTPGRDGAPPSDAIVLFDGADLSAWRHEDGTDARWTVADGHMTVGRGSGDILTRQAFGDIQLHIEWRSPTPAAGEGQGRGNSGIYFMERYELQVLDSYENRTYSNGQAGSVYKQHIPLVNASRPPGEWQSYDVSFTAPLFAADGSVETPAYMTVFHNGVLVLSHVEIQGNTEYEGLPEYEPHGPASILLQDHGDYVSYRNIWVRETSRHP